MDEYPERSLARLTSFSDGVFAVAITLLALDLRVPPGTTTANLAGALGALTPAIVSFVISFFVIGMYWAAHHRILRAVQRADDALMRLNLLVLFTIAVIPFPTSLMGDFGDTRLATVIYAATVAVSGFALVLLRRHVHSAGLIRAEDEDRSRGAAVRSLAAPLTFTLSIPVAVFSPLAARWMWYAVGGAYLGWDIVNDRLERRNR